MKVSSNVFENGEVAFFFFNSIFHGLTIVAFGNGAPDIFSAIAAFTNSNPSTAGVAVGALLGKCSKNAAIRKFQTAGFILVGWLYPKLFLV